MSYFYKHQQLLLLLISGLFLISSCEKFDKEEPIPAYIQIDKIDLIVPDSLKSLQGSNSSKISDAWIYLDDRLQGIYELPAKFPVLNNGEYNLRVQAGIKQNGIGSTRPVYPYYAEYAERITLSAKNITVVKPSVLYKTYTNFLWKENFDGVSVSMKKTSNSDTTFKVISNGFDGTKSMAGYLDGGRVIFECSSEKAYDLPTNGTSVFLEMNYRTNSPLIVGFIANVSPNTYPNPIVTLNPTYDENGLVWNKVYINLTADLENYQLATDFKIYFRVEKPADIANSEFYIDNIKLVQ